MSDSKLTGLTELAATPTTGDMVYIVDDPGGTPLSKKITVDNLSNFVAADTQTFTNKTIDANGTGNAISNIDVADLANGTDGELITWDASAAPAVVAVGTAGQVLTSGGVGVAPTFATAAGGLTGTTVKTIGSTGDYLDVAAFIAGESTPYHGVFVSDVTEDSAIPVDGSLYLNLDRYKLTMADNQFTYLGAGDVFISGDGSGSGAEIDYTFTTGKRLFDGASTDIVNLRGLTIDNNSSASFTSISRAIDRFDDVRIELANQIAGGINPDGESSQYSNVTFVGGGTACEDCVITDGGDAASFTNIHFEGTFIVAGASDIIAGFSNKSSVSNLSFSHDTDDVAIRMNGGSLSNLSVSGALNVDMQLSGVGCRLTNVNLLAGDIDPTSVSFHSLTNVETTGSIDLTDAGCDNMKLTNCRFTGALTVAGDRHKFNNCDFLGGGSASSGALHNIFTACQFGVDAGGGALTFTFASGANTNILTSCISDAAIVDNGTSNTIANNIVH